MDDTGFFNAELNSAAFGVVDSSRNIRRNRADFRVRHQATRAENLTETANERHHVRRCNAAIKVDLAGLNFLNQLFSTNDVSTGQLWLRQPCRHVRTRQP